VVAKERERERERGADKGGAQCQTRGSSSTERVLWLLDEDDADVWGVGPMTRQNAFSKISIRSKINSVTEGGEAGQVMMDRAAEAETRKVESPRRR